MPNEWARVERGETDSPALEAVLRVRLAPWLARPVGAVVLGCTHFPFASGALRRVLPLGTELIDGSDGTARQTARLLAEADLLRPESAPGEVVFRSTSPDPAAVAQMERLFRGESETE